MTINLENEMRDTTITEDNAMSSYIRGRYSTSTSKEDMEILRRLMERFKNRKVFINSIDG